MTRALLTPLLALTLALAACGADDSASDTPDPTPDQAPAPDPNPAPQPEPQPDPEPAPMPDPQPAMEPDVPPMPESRSVTLTTADDKAIAGLFTHPQGAADVPGVLLLHQFRETKAQWAALTPRLVAAGYAVLAIDLRGHGESDDQNGTPTSIFNDPNQAPLDLRAAIDFLADSGIADPSRLAVVGTSVGANLAVVADALDLTGVNTVVALSPRLSAVEALADTMGPIVPLNIACVAGELDSSGAQADTCRTLTENATGMTRLNILPDTGAHGTGILSMFPEENDAILDWLNATL